MKDNTDFIFTTKPFAHQEEALTIAWGNPAFAFFCEQGVGKSKIVVDEVVNLIERGMINCAVVLAPNGVHANWKEQFELHGPPGYDKWVIQVYYPKGNDNARQKQQQVTRDIINSGKVLVFLMSIDSMSHKYPVDYLQRILKARKSTYMAVDESHKIKTNSAVRTKMTISLGSLAKYRRIMTGTEAEEGLHNYYTQMKFLDWRIIGYKFYTPFKNMYCVMGGFENRQIVGYQNQSMLAARMMPYIYQKRKAECLDLPEKLYVTHQIELTPEQKNLYDRLENDLLTELDDGSLVDTTMILTRMTKLQQVLCGHLLVEGVTKRIASNRAAYVSELIEGAGKTIVFCRFIMDVKLVTEQLSKDKIESIGITGDTDDRLALIDTWKKRPDCKALVITTATGGTGLTMNEAKNTIFYSNSFSATDRSQAEDRNHRIGQDEHVTYHDLVTKGKIDSTILKALRSKFNLSTKFRDMIKAGKNPLRDDIDG